MMNDDSESARYEEALMRLYRPSKNHKYDSHRDALILFFRRPYWIRVWVIQEIASSKKVWVQSGSRCALWEEVVKVVESVPTAARRSRISIVTMAFPDLGYMKNVLSTDQLRRFSQEAKSKSDYVSLLNAMTRLSTALATILSNKIYGLLATTRDGQDLIPYPIYGLITEEICIITTTAIITTSADLDIICYAKVSPRRRLPS